MTIYLSSETGDDATFRRAAFPQGLALNPPDIIMETGIKLYSKHTTYLDSRMSCYLRVYVALFSNKRWIELQSSKFLAT